MNTTTVIIVVEKTRDGFSAFAENFPVFTTGHTLTAVEKNMTEALNLFFEDLDQQVNGFDLRMKIDIRQFLRNYRAINTKHLAARIGMNETLMSQYARGLKKPSARQAHRILAGIREIGKELSEIELLS